MVTGQDLNLRPSGYECGDHCFDIDWTILGIFIQSFKV